MAIANLERQITFPSDRDYVIELVIDRLVKYNARWKLLEGKTGRLKYPKYDKVYKTVTNSVGRHLDEINEEIADRLRGVFMAS